MNSCAHCGITQDKLPVVVYTPEGSEEEVQIQPFAIYDQPRNLYICGDHTEDYYRVLKVSVQYPVLLELNNHMLIKNLLAELEDGDRPLLEKMLPPGTDMP